MNLYVLVEGEGTEKTLYRAWLGHCFPRLAEVPSSARITNDHFTLLAGNGYPSYLRRIQQALEDCADHGNIDHLFIGVDSEEDSFTSKQAEITQLIAEKMSELARNMRAPRTQVHVFVADCCIETWLLGHQRFVPRQPDDAALRTYLAHHNVSTSDPETMPKLVGFRTRAQFHLDYLRRVFQHHQQTYSKTRPGIAREPNYLAALVDRCSRTTHLASFRAMWMTWLSLGAVQPTERGASSGG